MIIYTQAIRRPMDSHPCDECGRALIRGDRSFWTEAGAQYCAECLESVRGDNSTLIDYSPDHHPGRGALQFLHTEARHAVCN